MKNSMSIKNFVEIAKCLPSDISLLLRGRHGIGKSQVVKQIADHIRATEFEGEVDEYPFIDFRCGQITEGDIIGLPFQEDGQTQFMPPWWLKMACQRPCHIFLDEINRGTIEVMQAAFQLVLDRKIQNNTLHPQTRIYAAVNGDADYTVNEMDPALLDRFWTIDLEPTVDEWLIWARTSADLEEYIPDFIAKYPQWLDPPVKYEPGAVTPSRRSWERLSRSLKAANLTEAVYDPQMSNIFYRMCMGFIGIEATIQFMDYVKNHERYIAPEAILNGLVIRPDSRWNKKVTPDSDAILNVGEKSDKTEYDEVMINKLKSLKSERVNDLNTKLALHLANTFSDKKNLTLKQGLAIARYYSLLNSELKVSFWSSIMDGVGDKKPSYLLQKKIQPWIAPHLIAAYGVDQNR
jgi:hypothetical protein